MIPQKELKPVKQYTELRDWGATLLGFLVAIAQAWITIDWTNFSFTPNNITMLILSGVIAIGGWQSKIKRRKRR